MQRGADGRGEFVATAGAETPKAIAMPSQWSCRVREPTTQTGMGRSSLEGQSQRESPEGGSGGASGTKPIGPGSRRNVASGRSENHTKNQESTASAGEGFVC